MGSPAALRASAAALRHEARTAATALDGVTRVVAERVWSGPGATRLVDELDVQRATVRRAVADLERHAAMLDAQAEALEAALAAEAERQRRRAAARSASIPVREVA